MPIQELTTHSLLDATYIKLSPAATDAQHTLKNPWPAWQDHIVFCGNIAMNTNKCSLN